MRNILPPHDEFRREPFFQVKRNDSTYYDPEIDRQGCVPVRNLEELRKELEGGKENESRTL